MSILGAEMTDLFLLLRERNRTKLAGCGKSGLLRDYTEKITRPKMRAKRGVKNIAGCEFGWMAVAIQPLKKLVT